MCHPAQFQIKQSNTKNQPKVQCFSSDDSSDHSFFSFHRATGSFTTSHRCPKKSVANTGCTQQQSRLRESACSTKVTNMHQKLHLPSGGTILGRRFEEQWEDEPFIPCNLVPSACKQVVLDSIFPPFNVSGWLLATCQRPIMFLAQSDLDHSSVLNQQRKWGHN